MPKVSELIKVLGQHPALKFFRDRIDNRKDRVPIRDFQRSPGAKIVLHVNNQQAISVVLVHFDISISGIRGYVIINERQCQCIRSRENTQVLLP